MAKEKEDIRDSMYKNPVPKGFKRISDFPPLVTFDKEEDKGKSVEGTVIDVKTVQTPKSKTGEMTIATLKGPKGDIFAIALSASLLKTIPDNVGNYIKVEYLGMAHNPNTNLDFKKFDILVKEN